ncbi:hypothetical protein BDC45DRAFT_540841 [Circinella umbellata]|nr:hypothetical protein BDC45DRAFT_540841 [Circinella umbellata]
MCWIQQSVEPEFLMKNNSISIISSSGTITRILSIYVHGGKQALLNQCDKILRALLVNTEWPTAKIWQDLQLSPPLIHFVQQALAPVPHSSPLTTSQQLLDLQQCILELEASSLNYRRHTMYTNYNTQH